MLNSSYDVFSQPLVPVGVSSISEHFQGVKITQKQLKKGRE